MSFEAALSLLSALCFLLSVYLLSALCSLVSLCTALVLFVHTSTRRNGDLVVREEI